MKITRKRKDLDKMLAEAPGEKDGDIAPSLYIRGLGKPIDGLEGGKDFEAHIRGKCRGHECRDEGGKEQHSYDLDVHDFEHKGGGEPKKKKSPREEVEEAMDKFDKEDAEKKSKKEEPKKEKAEAK